MSEPVLCDSRAQVLDPQGCTGAIRRVGRGRDKVRAEQFRNDECAEKQLFPLQLLQPPACISDSGSELRAPRLTSKPPLQVFAPPGVLLGKARFSPSAGLPLACGPSCTTFQTWTRTVK